MERRDFLEKIGIGAAFVLTTSCFGACKNDEGTPTPAVDFTLDLNASDTVALKVNGGFIIKNQVVVVKDTTGKYVAATQVCSHEGNVRVTYDRVNNNFTCPVHGATFDLAGKGTNANGSKGLTIYKTELAASGASLRVFS